MKKFAESGLAQLDEIDMRNIKGGNNGGDNPPPPDDDGIWVIKYLVMDDGTVMEIWERIG